MIQINAQELFEGVRPSDMRYENFHVLAEYIDQAQELINSSNSTQEMSKMLLSAVHTLTKEGVPKFNVASDNLATVANSAIASFNRAGKDFLIESERAFNSPVSKLIEAAERLEAAAQDAKREKLQATIEIGKLARYREEVDKYTSQAMADLNTQRAKRTVFQRIREVFRPTKVPSIAKKPFKPTILKKRAA